MVWLGLAFIQFVKIFFTWYMIYAVYFAIFCIFYAKNYLGYFDKQQFHLPTTQSFLWRQGIKLEGLLGFENFQIVTHGFLGCYNLKKYSIFHFDTFLTHKKIFRVFCNSWIYYFWTYFQLYFQNIYSFIYFSPLRGAVKQLCDS